MIDRHGRRRLAMPGEVLADGERLTVSLVAMDSAPATPASPQAITDAEANRIAAESIARQRGGRLTDMQIGAAAAAAALQDYRNRSAR